MNAKPPNLRKTPIHLINRADYLPMVFVTVCAKDRKPIFANPPAHQTFLQSWQVANAWQVGYFMIMPDHVHIVVAPSATHNTSVKLENWVSFWKAHASRHWHNESEKPIWERSFWDWQIRSWNDYHDKVDYTKQNPVRAGLCQESSSWPYQGEIHRFS